MNQNAHALAMTSRFKEVFELSGESTLTQDHYDELALIIEAGLDSALIEKMENVAAQLSKLAHEIQHNAETER